MNGTKMSQQERDALILETYRQRYWLGGRTADSHTPYPYIVLYAAIRTIDALTTERDRLRADVDVVATALEAAYAYSTGKPERWGPGYEQVRNILRNAYTDLRAALADGARAASQTKGGAK